MIYVFIQLEVVKKSLGGLFEKKDLKNEE